MTIQQMRYLMAVIYTGSISEAAKQMYVAQSSISASVRELESEYGFDIFTRGSRGVELTRKGESLAIDLKIILEKIDAVQGKYANDSFQELTFSVSTQHHMLGVDAFCETMLGSDFRSYCVTFCECQTQTVMENVSAGLSDLGIIFLSSQSKALVIQTLRSLNLVFNHIAYRPIHIHMHKSHPLASATELLPQQLMEVPFISYDRTLETKPSFTETMNHSYRRCINVNDRAAAYTILEKLGGYIVGSGYRSRDEIQRGILAVPLQADMVWEVGWVSRIRSVLSEPATQFLQILTPWLHDGDGKQGVIE